MRYYAIQVMTRSEDDYRKLASLQLPDRPLIVPKRMMSIKRRGKIREQLLPVFPGYVFFASEDLLSELDTYWILRRTSNFIRFLRENAAPSPLNERELSLLRHFISFGEYADTSKVSFDENDRIVVLEGPLKGLEGQIVKVDRRKRRAKVALDMCQTGFLVDLSYEVVEAAARKGGSGDEDER
jgi:transcriptional antiterminator NusG